MPRRQLMDDEAFDHETKVVQAAIARAKFNNLKKTVEFGRWKRRQYSIVQHHKCAYCRKPIHFKKLHIDHVFPLYEGGRNTYDNFVLSCPRCNIRKFTRTPGKPLWIQVSESKLERKSQLNDLREEQQILFNKLLEESKCQ